MTQQDIVNELNRIVVGYNINWDTIKTDADRAIMKINSYLSADYPMISQIMLSPKHRYTVSIGGVDQPIFPERYILTVVVPFIALEILARDEEFTTIYNKFSVDLENGLFDMFQNEYNKVPIVFRQNRDVGVFFSEDHPQHIIHEHVLPDFSFNVIYHINFDGVFAQKFNIDEYKYAYGSTATVQDSVVKYFIHDIYLYKFAGWSRETVAVTRYINAEDSIKITSDVHLYAQWEKQCILEVDKGTGEVSIIEHSEYDVRHNIRMLNIPIYVQGKLVKVIPKDFDTNTSLVSLTLPQCNLTIKEGAITTVENLVLPAYDYLRSFPKVTIETGAIKAPLRQLYIPYSVRSIGEVGITNTEYIICEIDKPPVEWANIWYNDTYTQGVEWGVANG